MPAITVNVVACFITEFAVEWLTADVLLYLCGLINKPTCLNEVVGEINPPSVESISPSLIVFITFPAHNSLPGLYAWPYFGPIITRAVADEPEPYIAAFAVEYPVPIVDTVILVILPLTNVGLARAPTPSPSIETLVDTVILFPVWPPFAVAPVESNIVLFAGVIALIVAPVKMPVPDTVIFADMFVVFAKVILVQPVKKAVAVTILST